MEQDIQGGSYADKCLANLEMPATAFSRAMELGTGTGLLGRRLWCPHTPSCSGNSAGWPSISYKFPCSGACIRKVAHWHGGLLCILDHRMAFAWNTECTVPCVD